MAARRSWVVFVDDRNKIFHSDEYIEGKYGAGDAPDILSVYFRESHAIEAARQLAMRYPGKDVHVLQQSTGFYSEPMQPKQKDWLPDGQYVPTTK